MEGLTGRRLMVVAHPDDEVMWGGGLILTNPGDWTVIACSTPASDPDRAWRFQESLRRLGAVGYVSACVDVYDRPLSGLEQIELDGYDVIVTHGPAGEYGHPHHIQVSEAVRRRARCRVITFGYESGAYQLHLTPSQSVDKFAALQAYDHVLPYEGQQMPKWQALLHRYGNQWLWRETFD